MSLRHAVLGLLAEFPGSGYDLMKLFDKSLRSVWSATQSQVYTELNKLADDGLVVAAEQGPRGRKQYTVTESGLAELRRWLGETTPARNPHNESLLRVYFLSRLSPDQRRDYLTWLGETYAATIEPLRTVSAALVGRPSDFSRYSRLVIEYAVRHAAMTAEWTAWAAAQLDEMDQSRQATAS